MPDFYQKVGNKGPELESAVYYSEYERLIETSVVEGFLALGSGVFEVKKVSREDQGSTRTDRALTENRYADVSWREFRSNPPNRSNPLSSHQGD